MIAIIVRRMMNAVMVSFQSRQRSTAAVSSASCSAMMVVTIGPVVATSCGSLGGGGVVIDNVIVGRILSVLLSQRLCTTSPIPTLDVLAASGRTVTNWSMIVIVALLLGSHDVIVVSSSVIAAADPACLFRPLSPCRRRYVGGGAWLLSSLWSSDMVCSTMNAIIRDTAMWW